MKIGFNLLMVTTHVTEEHAGILEAIKSAGYDGVEVPVFEGEPAHYAALKTRLDHLGLEATALGIIPDAACSPISPDPAVRQRASEHLAWMVHCAKALGARLVCGPFHQPLGAFSGAGPTEDELACGADVHRAMAEEAGDLAIAIEPLNRFEAYVMNTAAQAASYVARVDRPNFGYLYDTFHAHIEEKSQTDAIAAFGNRIAHVHISENDRGAPGAGQVDFASVFKALKRINYDGWLTVEAFGSALPDLAAATRVWRPLFKSNDEVIAAGVRVIRDGWAAA